MSAINGHPLPPSLTRLASKGVWGPPHRQSLPPFGDQFQLLSVPDMDRNTQSLREMAASGRGFVFGLSSRQDDGLLDPEQIVVIAATIDEDALVLDYSNGSPPRVLGTTDQPGGVRWVEVASSFDELASDLGLA
jgi:hypothetical protein